MPRFDFQSPGANIVDSIQALRERKRLEERQVLLDQMAIKNSESQRAAQEANIEASKVRTEGERLGQATSGLDVGDDPTQSGMDPKLIELMRSRGMLGPKPGGATPSVSTDESFSPASADVTMLPKETVGLPQAAAPAVPPQPPAPSPANFYRGSSDQRDVQRKRTRSGEIIGAMMDPNTSPVQLQGLIISAAAEGITIPAGVASALQARAPYMIMDQQSGTLKPAGKDEKGQPYMAPPGDNPIINRTYPPRPLQGPAPQAFSRVGPDGKTEWSWVRPGQPIPQDAVRGNQPRPSAAAGKKGPMLPQGTVNSIADLRARASVPGAAQARDTARFWEAVNGALSTANVSDPSIAEVVRNLADNVHPVTGAPLTGDEDIDDIIEELAAQPGATAQEIAELRRLIRMTIGE